MVDFADELPGQVKDDPTSIKSMYTLANPSVEDAKDDGSIEASPIPGTNEEENAKHWENLAETLPKDVLATMSADLLDLIEEDKKAREKRDEHYAEGLRRSGLSENAPGGADFDGASRVVHPMLTKAAVDFSSTIMKELFPRSTGCVKDKIFGTATDAKIEKAQRKSKYMNWQLTEQMPEFRMELETMMTQVPMAGVQYLKLYRDERLRRCRPLFIPMDDLLIPYAATSFYASDRITHVQRITELEFIRRIKSGMYKKIDVTTPHEPEKTASAEANEGIEGKDNSSLNEDGERIVFETNTYYDLDGEISPYLISIDESTREVVGVYRNWEPDDRKQLRLDWIVDFPFVPWRGAAPIGLVQLIGGLSIAATGSLRALLDSAHVNNIPTALKLKGGSKGGQTLTLQPGQMTEIEGVVNIDDIRKTVMPVPFNPPNSTLFELLGFLVDAGDSVIQTVYKDIVDQNTEMPVGTTLMLIEQGMKVFSAIHARLHDSMGRLLKLLHRLNKMYIDEETVIVETGELTVRRADFEGPIDVVPISDPNVFSDTQRFAFMQMISQRAMTMPGLYDLRAIEEWILENSRIPNATRFLTPKKDPGDLNAVNENLAATVGRPVVAFPNQDHLAHIQIHLDFLGSPMLGLNILIGPIATPIIMSHLKEHISFYYGNRIYEVVSKHLGIDASEAMKLKDDEVNQQFEQLLAMASQQVTAELGQVFAKVGPVVQAAMQFMQGVAPPPPDPLKIEKQKADQEGQKIQAQNQYNQGKLQIDQQRMQGDQQESIAETQRTNAEMAATQLKAHVDMQAANQKHQTDWAKIEQSHRQHDLRAAVDRFRVASDEQRQRQDLATQYIMNEKDNQVKLDTNTADNLTALTIAKEKTRQEKLKPKGKSNGK